MFTRAARGPTTTRFPAEPASVGRVRHALADCLRETHSDDVVDMVALLASETVTNAVLHAGTEIEVTVEVRPAGVWVGVTDQSPVIPGIRHYGVEATTGRGLGMVELIASSWGVDSDLEGKTVWFVVDVPVDGDDHTG